MAHSASQWQIAPAGTTFDADTGFASATFDSGISTTHLVTHPDAGPLAPSTDYEATVRYRSSSGDWSQWAVPAAFSTSGNDAPTVAITAPADGATITQGDANTATATATDPEDGNLAALVEWSSDIDGALGTGASLDLSGLSVGAHTLTASVEDSGGLTDSDAILLTVEAPELVAGTAFTDRADSQITLSATAPTGGVPPYTYQWYRSTDGTKGSAIVGATARDYVDTGLTNGTRYYYTLDATDSASTVVSYAQVSAVPIEPPSPIGRGGGFRFGGFRPWR